MANKTLHIILFILVSSWSLLAQSRDHRSEIYRLFEDSSRIQWFKKFRGLADDLHPITITLAYDGKWCKGIYELESGGQWFHLEGVLHNKELKLIEIDQEENKTGNLHAQLVKNQLIGSWSNIDNSIGAEIKCREVSEDIAGELMARPFYWIRSYSGRAGDLPIELILQKIPNHRLSGVACLGSSPQAYEVKGRFETQNELFYKLRLSSFQDTLQRLLDVRVISDQELNITYTDSRGQKKNGQLKLGRTVKMDSRHFQNYFMSYDFSFPLLEEPKFEKYLQAEMAEWEKDCRLMQEHYPKEHPELGPVNRAQQQANCWFEPYYFSESLVSGRIVYTNTWSIFTVIKPINFDLLSQAPISLRDLFRKEVDPDTLIPRLVQDQLPLLIQGQDPAYQDWIEQAEFKLSGFTGKGICVSTDFDPTYGSESIYIPYAQLSPYLRPKNPIRSLIGPTDKAAAQ